MCVFALEHTLHRYFTGYIDILLFCRFDLVTRTSVDPPRKSKKKLKAVRVNKTVDNSLSDFLA